MANYGYEEGALTSINEIVDKAEENTSTDGSSLGFRSLGNIVQDVWAGKVSVTRRGPRNKRQSYYLNLKQVKQTASDQQALKSTFAEKLDGINIPAGWELMKDQSNSISFVRLEQWEFNNSRGVTELKVTESDNSLRYKVKAHCCEINLNNHELVDGNSALSVKARVCLALSFVEQSSLCTGVSLEDDEKFLGLTTHVAGSIKDLATVNTTARSVVFSTRCKVFSVPGGCCCECNRLKKLHNQRKERKKNHSKIAPRCNKRYLNKAELNLQLQQERSKRRNAERRESYWKDKFFTESIDLEEDDHRDLVELSKNLSKQKLPEEMECLWLQQKKILETRSKFGYRWHPKYVGINFTLNHLQHARFTDNKENNSPYVTPNNINIYQFLKYQNNFIPL